LIKWQPILEPACSSASFVRVTVIYRASLAVRPVIRGAGWQLLATCGPVANRSRRAQFAPAGRLRFDDQLTAPFLLSC